MEQHYEVRWDGTKARGAYLFCEAERPVPVPRPCSTDEGRTSVRARVLEALTVNAQTMRGLAAALHLDVHAVNGALSALRKAGLVAVVGAGWNERRHQREHLYALAEDVL